MRKVLCFGNEFVEGDKTAKKISNKITIPGYELEKCHDGDEILQHKDFIILDVVENIDKVTLIEDVDKLQYCKSVSCHDLDLTFYLKLAKELGLIREIRIIGVPQRGNLEEIKKDVEKILNSLPN